MKGLANPASHFARKTKELACARKRGDILSVPSFLKGALQRAEELSDDVAAAIERAI